MLMFLVDTMFFGFFGIDSLIDKHDLRTCSSIAFRGIEIDTKLPKLPAT